MCDGRKKEDEGIRDTRLLTTAGEFGGIRCPLTTAGGYILQQSNMVKRPSQTSIAASWHVGGL